MTLELLDEMKERRVERTTVTYSLLINACKKSGYWEEALKFLSLMEQDFNEVVVKVADNISDNEKVGDTELESRDHEGYESERRNRKEKEVERDNMSGYSGTSGFNSLKIDINTNKGDSREKYMKDIEKNEKPKGSLILSGLQPDTIVYSSVISVFVLISIFNELKPLVSPYPDTLSLSTSFSFLFLLSLS